MISIDIKNIKAVEKSFAKYGEKAVKAISNITKITAKEIEATAKTLAPVDDGTLRQSIKAEQQTTPLIWKITAYQPYSAFQEFGTGGKVLIQEGWGEMASRFKGAGIREVNLTPQPFMYPAFVKGRAMYDDDIEDELKQLNKKYNNGNV